MNKEKKILINSKKINPLSILVEKNKLFQETENESQKNKKEEILEINNQEFEKKKEISNKKTS